MNTISLANTSSLNGINIVRSEVSRDTSNDHVLTDLNHYDIECTNERATFVYLNDNQLIGYLTVSKTPIFNRCNDLMLEMFVHPQFQRQDVGSQLMEKCISYVKEMEIKYRITLSVLHSSVGAIALYKKFSFVVIHEELKGNYMAHEIQHQ